MTILTHHIVLTGFSGSGKSLVARLVAERLGSGWRAVDTDDLIEEIAGRSIAAIFASDGEGHFRALESEALRRACATSETVIATGGGAILSPDNRRVMADGGFVVCLEARPETILYRLKKAEKATERPLLAGGDPLARIRELKAQRQPLYALADYTVHTDSLTSEEVADEVVRAWRQHAARVAAAGPDRLAGPHTAPPDPALADATCVVSGDGFTYPVFVGWGALDDLGRRMRQVGLSGRAHVVTDDRIRPVWGERAIAALAEAGYDPDVFTIPAGEVNKTLPIAATVYDWLVERRAERGDVLVALGGGVVGDLGGFVAATFLRGIAFVQVPTSLLAMVDASIGGKTAVDHPQGKNLIGAFYQPRLVLADVSVLPSLPPRELTAGWAEAIKHAFIRDADLLQTFEAKVDELTALEPAITTLVVARSIAIKGEVVSEDPKETGLRMVLNYGHTIGHALEAAGDYGRLLHGEAVAIGMMGAAEIGRRIGVTPPSLVERQYELLQRFGLPTRATGINTERVLAAMALDKKVRGRTIRWILLEDVGRTVVRNDVPLELATAVVRELVE